MRKLYPEINGSRLTCFIDGYSSSNNIDDFSKFFESLNSVGLAVFYGSPACHRLSEWLCTYSLPAFSDGSVSSAVFVDGGNLFDPYYIASAARSAGLDPEASLRNIWVSRAFTSYQMTTLLTERLPELLDVKGSRLIVISDIAALYCDPEIELFEAKKTFNHVTCFLRNLAVKRKLLIVSTSLSSRRKRMRMLEQYLLGRASIALKVMEEKKCLKLRLEKHPYKPPVSAKLYFREEAQFLLEDCMEA